jgi:hypothetical protein
MYCTYDFKITSCIFIEVVIYNTVVTQWKRSELFTLEVRLLSRCARYNNEGNKLTSKQLVSVLSLIWLHVSTSGQRSKHVAKLKIQHLLVVLTTVYFCRYRGRTLVQCINRKSCAVYFHEFVPYLR